MRINKRNTIERVIIFLFLAAIIWIAHFWYTADFGLYADDYSSVSSAMNPSWQECLNTIIRNFTKFYHGRPISLSLQYLLPFLGWKFGGLRLIYLICYSLVAVNAFLFYMLLRRLSHKVFAAIGAVAFCLFPAYAIPPFITLLIGYQPTLMLFLIGSHLYLSGRVKLAYLAALGILLSYESVFPIFLAVPLLKMKWDAKLIKELFRHALVLAGILVFVLIIRKLTGEEQLIGLAGFNVSAALSHAIHNTLKGPFVCMEMYLYRPMQTIWQLSGGSRSLTKESLALICLSFAGVAWVLSRLRFSIPDDAFRFVTLARNKIFDLKAPAFFKNFHKLVLTGWIMLVLAYPLTITLGAGSISGIQSRVHFAAIIGATILCACACSAFFFILIVYGKRWLGVLVLSGFFALHVGFGLVVQQDYRLNWEYQKTFFTKALKLCPDITSRTVILVEPTGLPDTKEIRMYSWGVCDTFGLIYNFPAEWKKKPELLILYDNWQNCAEVYDLSVKEHSFEYGSKILPYQFPSREVRDTDLIFLEMKDGRLTRRIEPLIIRGKKITLKKPPPPAFPPFEKGPLYTFLIEPSK